MEFKSEAISAQFKALPKKLQEIVELFEYLSGLLGKKATVTRCWDPVPGDSGVHEAHRGVDCRDETDARLFTDDETKKIVSAINSFYPRNDGKPTVLHHSFCGGKLHFHFQVPIGTL